VRDDELTAEAVQLAERILDEVIKPGQNWCNIAALARALASLADAAAAGGSGPRMEES
jgi:hypothetical protein